MVTIDVIKQALQVIAAQREWICAVPMDTPLPAMPGFDREWADEVEAQLARLANGTQPKSSGGTVSPEPGNSIDTPEKVREFFGSNFDSLRYGREDQIPDEDDKYTMSAHDIISAFEWSADRLAADAIRQSVESFAKQSGWTPEDGEGAFEFVQRKCYEQGRADALQVASNLPDVFGMPFKDAKATILALNAEDVKALAISLLIQGRILHKYSQPVQQEVTTSVAPTQQEAVTHVPPDATPEEWQQAIRRVFIAARNHDQTIPSHWLYAMRDELLK